MNTFSKRTEIDLNEPEIDLNESEIDLNECEIDLNESEIDLNESEIDLNECEHFLKANLDRSKLIQVGSYKIAPIPFSIFPLDI